MLLFIKEKFFFIIGMCWVEYEMYFFYDIFKKILKKNLFVNIGIY